MRRLLGATLTAPNPDMTAAIYQEWFGYQRIGEGAVSAAQAQAWGTPAMAGRRFVTLAPASGVAVWLRLVASAKLPAYVPLRSHGWAAIELCVQDVQAVHARLQASPFQVIGPPRALDGAPAIWPMQVQGPDGEIIFLTEIRGDAPGARLPRAACAVDCLFIGVLACADLAATRDWFQAKLSLSGGPDMELAYTTLSRAFGLDAATKHRIAVLGDGEDAFLQLDQYPPAATARPARSGELPPGVAMLTLAAAEDAVLRTPEGAIIELQKAANF